MSLPDFVQPGATEQMETPHLALTHIPAVQVVALWSLSKLIE